MAPGVYRFRDESGKVLYIGRAVNLRRRVASYWGDLRGRRHLRPMVARIDRIEAVHCDSEHEAAWLERALLEHRKPPGNRAIGGAEVPVYIRLDERTATPGLSVVHDTAGGGRFFGPYLGGLRVRTAVGALHRTIPLSYAAPHLTSSGRAMAAALGIDPADRDALTGAVVGVLENRPAAVAAVRTELLRRRAQAAEVLSFELAAKVQAELAAIDWVCSDCKVVSQGATEYDVCGYADGLLITLSMRAGRMSQWRTRACSPASAGERVSSTPAVWQEFAARNAELAVRLAVAQPIRFTRP